MINGLTTPHSIEMYRMVVIRSGLKVYLETGMKVNRMYTPGRMVEAISQKTGKQYKRSKNGMKQAFEDITQWLLDNRTLNKEELPL